MNYVPPLLGFALVILLFGLTDPFMYWMPPAAGMFILVLAVGIVAIFAGFIMHERGGDERDQAHRSFAGRVAYLAGLFVLTAALLVQGFTHALDPWISLSLGTMVIAKLLARAYANRFH